MTQSITCPGNFLPRAIRIGFPQINGQSFYSLTNEFNKSVQRSCRFLIRHQRIERIMVRADFPRPLSSLTDLQKSHFRVMPAHKFQQPPREHSVRYRDSIASKNPLFVQGFQRVPPKIAYSETRPHSMRQE